jgi:hypothetical protein
VADTRTLQIDQYSKLEFTVAVLVAGVAKPLTGWTAKMQIRTKKASATILAEYTTEDGTISINGVLGQILVDVPGTRTAALNVTSGVYDLYVISPTSVPYRVLEGNVLISLSTTRPVGA